MMQELLGGTNVGIMGERSKISTPTCGGGGGGGILDHGSPSPSVSPSPSSSAASGGGGGGGAENLRCPRCDSSNTKFCYYNNYNLTQPRHFCKTCRRYWTKGGALRNVPIGGGCRKNKSAPITAAVGKTVAAAKFKSTASSEIGKSSLFGGFEHADTLSSNPIIWASSQNSHFLSLIRGNQSQNQNQTSNPNHHLSNSLCMKEESGGGGGSLFGASHFSSDAAAISNDGSRAFLDHFGPAHLPSYRNNQTLASQGLILHGEVQNSGLQELYHRLRSSATSCYSDHAPVILGSMASANSSSTAAILESAPVAAAEMGFWNSTVSWPENFTTTTTNGAYP